MIGCGRSFAMVMHRQADRFTCVSYELADGLRDGAALGRYRHADHVADLLALTDHLRLGRPDEALPRAYRALDHGPLRARTLHLIGRVYVALKSPDRAREYFERALALEPTDAKVRSDLSRQLKRVVGGGR